MPEISIFVVYIFNSMQLLITEDGSHTIFSPQVEECYHSQHGAMQESEHIFIQAGWEQCPKTEIKVLEIGFGTGLNALLTLVNAEKQAKKVNYTTLELYPLGMAVASELNFTEQIAPHKRADFIRIHEAEWGSQVAITLFFCLEKIKADFTQIELSDKYDLIYFDAFSPEKQPEMWTQERFELLYRHTNQGGILTTYCSKGVVRRAMQAAGYQVERLPGPPGKRQILRATKI